MLSFIEIGFYISLAVMLCLLFLLINHLKSRIITLENQNEGMMDVMKMIRGNLVNSDKEQKQVKESLLSLAKNVSQVSTIVHTIQNKPLERNNITLDVEDLPFEQGNITNEWTAESEEEDTEDETQELAEEENNELEVVNIDWPSNEEIEIHKLTTEDLSEYDDPELQKRIMDMAQLHISSPMFMNSSDASELQKMFFMMSMGNGVPMSNIVFENIRDYEKLPESYDDPDVEELPESPLPELVDDPDVEALPESVDLDEDETINAQIDDLIAEVTKEETPDVEETPIAEQTPVVEDSPIAEQTPVVEDSPIAEQTPVVEDSPVAEQTPVVEDSPVAEEKENDTTEKEKSMDFSKMDLRSLRSLVSTQGKIPHEKISKMKKAELIRALSSSE